MTPKFGSEFASQEIIYQVRAQVQVTVWMYPIFQVLRTAKRGQIMFYCLTAVRKSFIVHREVNREFLTALGT